MTSLESKAVRIRPALPEEADRLSDLALRSKAHWGYDEEFMRNCAAELTFSGEAISVNPTFAVECEGRVLGFYMLERRGKGEVELEALFVEPDAIGQGYGKKLMRHAQKTALEMGCRTVIIQGDPHAEPFYASIGARRIGTRPSASIVGRELPLFRLDLK